MLQGNLAVSFRRLESFIYIVFEINYIFSSTFGRRGCLEVGLNSMELIPRLYRGDGDIMNIEPE